MRSMTLEPGLRLDPARLRDARELHAAVTANRAHLRRWLPWAAGRFYRIAETRRFLRLVARQARRGEPGQRCWLIRLDGRIVGSIGFVRLSPEQGRTEIGYWLAKEACGRGIATKASRRLLAEAFGTMRLNRVEIVCGTGNRASRAVPRRLGMRLECVQRQAGKVGRRVLDLAVYAMLRSEARRMLKSPR